MLELFHGDNQVLSRQALTQRLIALKADGQEYQRVSAGSLSLPELEALLGNTNLFGQAPTIIIEELHSLPKSSKKDSLINLIAQHDQLDVHLLLWEKKAVTAAQQKKLQPTKAQEFKVAASLFKWLESLRANYSSEQRAQVLKLQHQALTDNDEFTCLVMLVRHVRLLIQSKTGPQPAGAPFVIAKLKHQTEAFTLPELLKLHQDLLELDRKIKTSAHWLSLGAELDLLGWSR